MTLIDKIEKKIKITKYGYGIISASLTASFIFLIFGLYYIFFPVLLFTFFSIYFFRDPERIIPDEENALVSPADGRVLGVEHLDESPYDGSECIKVSIFMSVFNVHVNRVPFSGQIKEIKYFPGKFFNASFDKASSDNERNAVLFETHSKKTFWTVQIAGLIARRIVMFREKGDIVEKGERFGMIKFGSRLELYLPADSEIEVKNGNIVKAGSTIICKLN
ncbi:MAG: phosphatidylserine decarboxylase family protein [Deltaproteobacteria bacterium]|nr:MAG: phosphatidylserine decarboxylase family protein [Deltaproteobacteria bacterium]